MEQSVFCVLCLTILGDVGIKILWNDGESESFTETHIDCDGIVRRLVSGYKVEWARDYNLWMVGLFAVTYVKGDAMCYQHVRAHFRPFERR